MDLAYEIIRSSVFSSHRSFSLEEIEVNQTEERKYIGNTECFKVELRLSLVTTCLTKDRTSKGAKGEGVENYEEKNVKKKVVTVWCSSRSTLNRDSSQQILLNLLDVINQEISMFHGLDSLIRFFRENPDLSPLRVEIPVSSKFMVTFELTKINKIREGKIRKGFFDIPK